MPNLLIAIVGDVKASRDYTPPSNYKASAQVIAEQIGEELCKQGARLLVYGGPYLESDVVRGYVRANPKKDKCIKMWYTEGVKPDPFPEEGSNANLFERVSQQGADWEVAFYRSIAQADGIILMGGGNATQISGQVAIGIRMPIMALAEFGGGAAKVRATLSAGEDLPTRDEINLMARPWDSKLSAAECVKALFSQYERKQAARAGLGQTWTIVGGALFMLAVLIIPWVSGQTAFKVWAFFFAPMIAGGSGAIIRQMIAPRNGLTLTSFVLGLVAGGIAGLLFLTAQFTADPDLSKPEQLFKYITHSIIYAISIGFIGGLTTDLVFSKLFTIDVLRTTGVSSEKEK